MPFRSRHHAIRALFGLAALTATAHCGGCAEPETYESMESTDLVEAAQWTRIVAEGSETGAGPRVDLESGLLLLPADEEIVFFLRVPKTAWLAADRLSTRGDASPLVVVEFRREGQETVDLELTPGEEQKPSRIRLPSGDHQVSRLSLRAPQSDDPNAVVVLRAPRIETPGPQKTQAPRPERSEAPNGRGAANGDPPNLVIYLVDTLRKDRLGVYGYDRPLTPEFDRFATSSTVYRRAFAQSSWTRPSVASIFTGLEPHIHGVNDQDAALPDAARTLAEILQDHGYETAAFITNGNVGPEFNFDQGFEVFSRPEPGEARADQLNDRLSRYLDARTSDRPLFLYVHTIDPHAPYRPDEIFRSRFATDIGDPQAGEIDYLRQFRGGNNPPSEDLKGDVIDLYDAEVAFTDHSFGEFVHLLRQHDLFDESWIAVTSDHGEEFWDHGSWGHGQSLFGELIDIPLLVKSPGVARGSVSDRLTQHIDLFATALDHAGVVQGAGLHGWSLLREIDDGSPRTVFSIVNLNRHQGRSVIEGQWKLIQPDPLLIVRSPQLFNLRRDPGETQNLYARRQIRAGYLEALLRRHEANAGLVIGQSKAEMSEELIRELKALGYID